MAYFRSLLTTGFITLELRLKQVSKKNIHIYLPYYENPLQHITQLSRERESIVVFRHLQHCVCAVHNNQNMVSTFYCENKLNPGINCMHLMHNIKKAKTYKLKCIYIQREIGGRGASSITGFVSSKSNKLEKGRYSRQKD